MIHQAALDGAADAAELLLAHGARADAKVTPRPYTASDPDTRPEPEPEPRPEPEP